MDTELSFNYSYNKQTIKNKNICNLSVYSIYGYLFDIDIFRYDTVTKVKQKISNMAKQVYDKDIDPTNLIIIYDNKKLNHTNELNSRNNKIGVIVKD